MPRSTAAIPTIQLQQVKGNFTVKVLLTFFALILSCSTMSPHIDNATPIVHLVKDTGIQPADLRTDDGAFWHWSANIAHNSAHGSSGDVYRRLDGNHGAYFYRLRWNAPLTSPRIVPIAEVAYFPHKRTEWKAYKNTRFIRCDAGTVKSRLILFSSRLSGDDGSRGIANDTVCTVRILSASDTTPLWNHGLSWHYEIGAPAQLVFGERPQTTIEQPWLE